MAFKNTNPIIVHRATKKRKEQEERELDIQRGMDKDYRRDHLVPGQNHVWIRPIIEEDEN